MGRAGQEEDRVIEAHDHDATPVLQDYLNLLWRRKWIVLQAIVLIPFAAVMASKREAPLYEASATVLLNVQNLPANLEGVHDPTQLSGSRTVNTQAEVARAPEVARRTVEAVGVADLGAGDLLGMSTVAPAGESDVLRFTVTGTDRELTALLATEYATQFTQYRLELDTRALQTAREAAQRRIEALEAAGDTSSALYESLVNREQQLETMESLQTARAVLVRPAGGAAQIAPNPTRNGIVGLALGLLLGVGLAFLREAFDNRVRSAKGVSDQLGLPLLARLPRPPRPLRRRRQLVMLADPHGPHAEAFRILETNVELANAEWGAATILVTSAGEQEGKSTTAANLAVAFARAGKRVVLVDGDFRSPTLHRFFELDQDPGLTEAAVERASLDLLLRSVDIDVPGASQVGPPRGGNGRLRSLFPPGSLEVLTAGTPPSTPELALGAGFGAVLEQLRQRSDLVLIDSAPLLRTGDALALSTRVDALLVVARLNVLRRAMLEDFGRFLRSAPAAKLGLVVTDAELETGYGYLRHPYQHERSRSERASAPL